MLGHIHHSGVISPPSNVHTHSQRCVNNYRQDQRRRTLFALCSRPQKGVWLGVNGGRSLVVKESVVSLQTQTLIYHVQKLLFILPGLSEHTH